MNLSEKRKQKLGELVVRLGVKFNDLNLLNQALTHTSYANEAKDHSLHNERLEFLGDAVLELASSTYLFKTFTQMPEGEMTKARASVVCETSLADAFESIIGAIYLDQGWQTAYEYVLDKLNEEFIAVKYGYNLKDYKTILQEVVQAKGQHVEYKLLAETGPDHAKTFEFAVVIDKKIDGKGKGTTKKEAEQHAAYEALKKYGIEK